MILAAESCALSSRCLSLSDLAHLQFWGRPVFLCKMWVCQLTWPYGAVQVAHSATRVETGCDMAGIPYFRDWKPGPFRTTSLIRQMCL